jgi:hypothetical protein
MALIDELIRARRSNRPSNIDVNRQIVEDDLIDLERRRREEEDYTRLIQRITEADLLQRGEAQAQGYAMTLAQALGIPRSQIVRRQPFEGEGTTPVYTNVVPPEGGGGFGENIIGRSYQEPIGTPAPGAEAPTLTRTVGREPITAKMLRRLPTTADTEFGITAEQVSKTPAVSNALRDFMIEREKMATELEQQRIASAGGIRQAEITAGAKEAKPLSDTQARAFGYAQRIGQAEQIFSKLEPMITSLSTFQLATQRTIPNALKEGVMQEQEQAERNFVNAVLRRESGAVISDQEFDNAKKQYFPQPGDTAKVLAQKKQNRVTVYQNLMREGGQDIPSNQGNGDSSSNQQLNQILLDPNTTNDKRKKIQQALQEGYSAQEIVEFLNSAQ